MPPLPSAGRRSASRSCRLPGSLLIARTAEIELDDLRALFRRRSEFPLLDGVLARLNKKRVSANNPSALDVPIRSDYHFDFYLARHVHTSSKFRIDRRDLGLYFALAFIRRTRLSKTGRPQEKKDRCCENCASDACATSSNRHYPSSEWGMPQSRKGTSDATRGCVPGTESTVRACRVSDAKRGS